MNSRLNEYCSSFLHYRTAAEKSLFKWSSSYTLPTCAGILSSGKKPVTEDDLMRCKKLIKSKTNVFSDFRGIVLEPMSCMLAVAEDPEMLSDNALAAYSEMRRHFRPSDYLALVALIVARLAEADKYAEIADKTRAIYDCMKNDHPFLTSSEDAPFAAMMTFSGRSAADICDDADECYGLLRSEFSIGNDLQSVSHVLTLGEENAHQKCDKLIALYNTLKMRGYKYGRSYELPVLAALSIHPEDASVIADDIAAAADMLKGERGYGIMGASRTERLMHAAMIVSNCYNSENNVNIGDSVAVSSAITAAVSMAAAEQAAVCAAIAVAAANSTDT